MDFVFLCFMISFSVTNAALSGPEAVNGTEGQSVQITCAYNIYYRSYQKYWCKGRKHSTCTILVQTQGSKKTSSDGRISITDDNKAGEFSVTMEQLTLSDQDSYWCGIMRFLKDLQFHVKLDVIGSHQLFLPITDKSSAQEIWKNNSKYYFIWSILRWAFLAILLVWGIVTMRM